MALTTTQVNQAFLATLGRPAEGSAATWGSTSLSLGALSDSIFIAENTEDFVESLYTEILGRASDAEGKAFWNSLLATTSKEAVLAQFKAAVIAAGQADPSNADYQSFIAQNKAFVATLYANLLGRDDAKTADAEGIDFWANALATGMSRGDLISAFVSAALSDPNSDDAQTLNAKLSVADAYTAAFNDFGKDVTADEKKAAYAQLVEQMKEVVAGSTVEEFQDAINQFKGQNQDRKTDVFTKGEDDLDASESTAATTFRGTINISNPDKSTIESGDTATGNSEYAAANTLIVDVKSDGKEKDFTYSTEMAGVKINNVDNLTINNGTADVTLNLDGNNADFGGKVAITGKGDTANVTVAQDVASLNVSTSGAKKAYTDVTVNSGNTLGAFEGSAAKDTLTISGNIAKSINTGDGKDNVTLEAAAKVFEKATISLGGGDDILTINTSDIGNYNADGKIATEDLKASVTIDGGAGTKDKLVLNNSDISAGVKAITGVEFIDSTLGAISAAAADGLKTSVEGTLTVKADYTNTKTIDLRGIKAVKDNAKKDLGSLSLSDITYENITLSSNISENIVVAAHTADSKKSYAEINKFAADDRISVGTLAAKARSTSDKNLDLTNYNDVKTLLSGETGAVAINDAAGKKSYIWQVDGLTTPKLVAIVDKKLKADAGLSFVYDDSKTTPSPVDPQANDSVNYTIAKNLQGGNTFDLTPDDSGNFTIGNGDESVKFKAPKETTDAFTFTGVNDALTLSGSGVAGTVKMFVSKGGTYTLNDNATNAKSEVYVGGTAETTSSNTFDISGVTLTNIDKLFINTTAEVKADSSKLGTTKIYFTQAVDAAGAKIKFADINSVTVDINSYFADNVIDANETITFKTITTANTSVIGSKGMDNITIGVAHTGDNLAINLGEDAVKDTLDLSADTANATAAGDLPTNLTTVSNANQGDAIKLVAGAKVGNTTKLTGTTQSNEGAKEAINAALKALDGGKSAASSVYLVDVKQEGTKASENGLYLVYTKAAEASLTGTDDMIVKLDGTVAGLATVDASGFITLA